MEENPPRYPHTKYEKKLSMAAEIKVIKNFEVQLVIERANGLKDRRKDGRTEGRTDERTDGIDENYIPIRHTSYAGVIMNESEETEEIKTFPSTLTCCKDSRPCPTEANTSWTPR